MTSGHKAWKVLITLCGLSAATIGVSINTSGVFYGVVSEALGIYRGSFAFHMTIFSIVTAIAGLFVIKLLEKVPFKLLMWVSIAVGFASTALMGMASHLWQFYLLSLLRGFSTGMFSIMTLTYIINYWFNEKNGLATSITLSFSGIIGALISPVLAKVIQSQGWQFAFLVQGLIFLAFCLPALLFPFKLDPRQEGLTAYGFKEKEEIQDALTDLEPTSHFKVNSTLIAMIVFGVSLSFITSMAQHFPGFAETLNLDVTVGASLLSMAMLGNILSKLVVGFLSDKIGAIKANFVLIFALTLGILLLIIGKTPSLLMPGAFLLGASFGILAVATPLLTRHIYGVNDYGKAYPLIGFASNLGAAIAFSAIGFIYDFTKSYYPSLFLFLALIAIGSLAVIYANKKGKA
ncbi:MFS transporter [Streptococcus uberis]|uniref:MFS transporter n=1 Tax=Streptococcus uberis TaxID=1349 RepID=A0A6L6G9E7_STRUB|nr:MFS transporter [Streptococcus uberis]MTB36359.1 MFS transporter [Streptococcus uberis]MTB37616.1 MFS transporter [Streptococcus uberis]MTB54226.1 MFS transporter [Streptococcus uberis]MTB61388.1 MFS transporter [Streptococcus uberis]MTB78836.1 MFS transporter [Streptococcus uberis]